MSEWRTIDSAPRDGSMVLLGYLDVSGKFAVRSARWFLVHHRNPEKEWAWSWVCEVGRYLLDPRPTHWMPLPEPPTDATH